MTTPPDPPFPTPARARGRLAAWLVLGLVAAWVFWLRWPSFSGGIWNLDEGIYATSARTILEGGVMYRDTLDHRTPLSHYLVAAVFAVAGVNNLWAAHAFVAAVISLTALGIFLLGRLWRGSATGLWAAVVFAAFSCSMLYAGDAYSVGTEWFVVLFTTWGAWWFWAAGPPAGFWRPFGTGAVYAAAFLCKQPAMLDFGAPLGLVVYLAALGQLRLVPAARVLGGLAAGFVSLTALAFAYFWSKGALDSFYFYGWAFNFVYYVPETMPADRWKAVAALLEIVAHSYPVLLATIALAGAALFQIVVQRQPSPADRTARVPAVFLLLWLALSVAGAATAGRSYGHYYIQTFPALALAAGWILGPALRAMLQRGNVSLRLAAAALVLAAGASLVVQTVRGRARTSFGPDPGLGAAEFIKAHSLPSDRIFVWGLNPDFYWLADRPPASRFIYCSFLTGLMPWTNAAPGVDTSYAIVPGAMEQLLQDLDSARPLFFVDTTGEDYRRFTKYPLARFRRLAGFVAAHYLPVEAAPDLLRGYRLYLLKDSSRRSGAPLAGGTPAATLAEPSVRGIASVEPAPQDYRVSGRDSAGRLQRLELLVDGAPLEGVTCGPSPELTARFTLPLDRLGPGRYTLTPRATGAGGESRTGPPLVVECNPSLATPEQLAAFALPTIAPGAVPVRASSPYALQARFEDKAMVYFAHAPSVLSYPVTAEAARLSGRFGFRPGAYAESNTGRTDGAEFSVAWVGGAGARTVLFHRLLRPAEEPRDRGEQSFDCALPAGHGAGAIELAIGEGPAGNAASDWTYWTDLLLTNSR